MGLSKISVLQLDGEGGATALNHNEAIELADHAIWIQLSLEGAKAFLTKSKLLSPFAITLLCAKETRPRIITQSETLMGSFRGVNLNPNSEPEDMVSIRFYINKNLIITVHKRNLASTKEIEQALQNKTGPKSSADFIETLLRIINEKAELLTLNMDEELDKIEDDVDYKQIKFYRRHLGELRRRIILLKRHLQPQRDALIRLPHESIPWLTDIDMLKLRESSDAAQRVLEDLDAEKDRASVIYEELFSLAQERLNTRMYVLAIVAALFLPLTFLTGLLGINVGGIPGANNHHAFWIVCLIMLMVFALIFAFLKAKEWF